MTYLDRILRQPFFKSIKSYKGNVFGGVFHGKGELTFTNGDIYTGNFLFGRRQGFGIYKHSESNNEYHGTWHDDKLHGECGILFGNDVKKGVVSIGKYINGLNTVVKEVDFLKSYITDEYDYSPKISQDCPMIDEKYMPFNWDLENMLILAF